MLIQARSDLGKLAVLNAQGGEAPTVTVENSALLSSLMLFPKDPTRLSPVNVPPSAVLKNVEDLTREFHLGDFLSRCRSPDFLKEVMDKHGPQRTLGWLLPLVSKNAAALDNLPVSALFHLLLSFMDSTNDFSLKALSPELKKVLERLRLVLQSSTDHSTEAIRLVLQGLSGPASQKRSSKVALRLLFSEEGVDTQMVEAGESAPEQVEKSTYDCLVSILSMNLNAEQMEEVSNHIFAALDAEEDIEPFMAYVRFLSVDLAARQLTAQDSLVCRTAFSLGFALLRHAALAVQLLRNASLSCMALECLLKCLRAPEALLGPSMTALFKPEETISVICKATIMLLSSKPSFSAQPDSSASTERYKQMCEEAASALFGKSRLQSAIAAASQKSGTSLVIVTEDTAVALAKSSNPKLYTIGVDFLSPSQLLGLLASFGLELAVVQLVVGKLLSNGDMQTAGSSLEECTLERVIDHLKNYDSMGVKGAGDLRSRLTSLGLASEAMQESSPEVGAFITRMKELSVEPTLDCPAVECPATRPMKELVRIACTSADIAEQQRACDDIVLLVSPSGEVAAVAELLVFLHQMLVEDPSLLKKLLTTPEGRLLILDLTSAASSAVRFSTVVENQRTNDLLQKSQTLLRGLAAATSAEAQCSDLWAALSCQSAALAGASEGELEALHTSARAKAAVTAAVELQLQTPTPEGLFNAIYQTVVEAPSRLEDLLGQVALRQGALLQRLLPRLVDELPGHAKYPCFDWLRLTFDLTAEVETAQGHSQPLFKWILQHRGPHTALLLSYALQESSLAKLEVALQWLVAAAREDCASVNTTSALAFIGACVRHPSSWLGYTSAVHGEGADKSEVARAGESGHERDGAPPAARKLPFFSCGPHCVRQVLRLALQEATEEDLGAEEAETRLEERTELVLELLAFYPSQLEGVVEELLLRCGNGREGEDAEMAEAGEGSSASAAAGALLKVYLDHPSRVHRLLEAAGGAARVDLVRMGATALLRPCRMDALVHRLLRLFLDPQKGERAFHVLQGVAIAHPSLTLRHLPAMTALLQGRSRLSLQQFLQRGYHRAFSFCLAVAGLLVPEVHTSPALPALLQCYFDLFANVQKQRSTALAPLLCRFVEFLYFYLPARDEDYDLLVKGLPVLEAIYQQLPELGKLPVLVHCVKDYARTGRLVRSRHREWDTALDEFQVDEIRRQLKRRPQFDGWGDAQQYGAGPAGPAGPHMSPVDMDLHRTLVELQRLTFVAPELLAFFLEELLDLAAYTAGTEAQAAPRVPGGGQPPSAHQHMRVTALALLQRFLESSPEGEKAKFVVDGVLRLMESADGGVCADVLRHSPEFFDYSRGDARRFLLQLFRLGKAAELPLVTIMGRIAL